MSENAEKGTSACITLFGERSNLRLCLASHARILSHACNPGPTKHLYWVRAVMSGEWCWRTNCTLSPFSLRLMESQLERETCIFSSLRTAIFQNVQSLQYIRKDVMVISVPYECPTWEIIVFISCTVWHHVYYDYLTVTSSVQLPTAVKSACRSP